MRQFFAPSLVAIMLAATIILPTIPAITGSAYGAGSSDPPPSLRSAVRNLELNKYTDALVELQDLARRQPSNADIQNYLGFAYRKIGQWALAEKHYARALALDPDHRGAHEYMGQLFIQTGRLDRAEALLTNLERLCPQGCEELNTLTAAFDGAAVY